MKTLISGLAVACLVGVVEADEWDSRPQQLGLYYREAPSLTTGPRPLGLYFEAESGMVIAPRTPRTSALTKRRAFYLEQLKKKSSEGRIPSTGRQAK
ncbi:hypothetical protein [Singulisphaera acidiphila]|uniref:Uncharacterized protein n=1 Tax=Singulisphaera acidiphila (strain ATCC BAA-1392 / DSM 18658 / VKM B-2454 / MOB10) TaxID=886293 RepID=L0DIR8_SINAD|nr:hypothetical protein [Singulisphaera acidiphila]AGA29152.1 hypothetical protein Sinac_4997 [Singulisphaera acidiphila DSM 18658]